MKNFIILLLISASMHLAAQEVKTVLTEELETKTTEEEVLVEDEKKETAPKKEFIKEEDRKKIENTAKSIGSGTKGILRKLGRKSLEETCHLTNSEEVCAQQKIEHDKQRQKEAENGIEPF